MDFRSWYRSIGKSPLPKAMTVLNSLASRERVQDSLVQFRRDGACLDFDTQPAPVTESQLFSEAGNTSVRRP